MFSSKLRIFAAFFALLTMAAGCSRVTMQSANAPAQPSLEARRAQIAAHDKQSPSPESLARKNRSLAILKTQNIPFSATLPVIADSKEARRRTTREVAQRAVALCVVAMKADNIPQPQIEKVIKDYGIKEALSPKERAFVDDLSPSQHERMQFSWRYESYGVMLWALGFLDKLPPPNTSIDVTKIVAATRSLKSKTFLQKARLRSQAEILDEADLIYRYHWLLVENQLKNQKAPSQLNVDVVSERHQALNWLIGYMNQPWDDVTTDT
jgi:hypothetical protein